MPPKRSPNLSIILRPYLFLNWINPRQRCSIRSRLYLFVEIDSAWRLPWDRHPNARAAHAIANAIAAQLRAQNLLSTSSRMQP
jgi:hypothetical protein